MDPNAALDPFAYALEAIPTDDPEARAAHPRPRRLLPDPNKGTVVFTGDLTLRVGDHTFHCLWTPGHTPGQLAVHVPEERVVFTGDTIFSELPDLADDLERRPVARGARADPRSSTSTTWSRATVRSRRSSTSTRSGPCCIAWKAAVADAVAKGWTREETIARVRFDDAFGPVDVGQGYMMDHIQNNNAGSLWDKLTALGLREGPLNPRANVGSRRTGTGVPPLPRGRPSHRGPRPARRRLYVWPRRRRPQRDRAGVLHDDHAVVDASTASQCVAPHP